MASKPRILYATPVLRHPPNGGPTLRVENSIKALAQIARVSVYARLSLDAAGGLAATRFYRRVCAQYQVAPHARVDRGIGRFARRVVNKTGRLFLGRNLVPIQSGNAAEDYADVLRAARRFDADVIWLGYGNVSYPLLKFIKTHSSYPVVLDTDSVWSRFVLRGLPYAGTDVERAQIEDEGRAKEEEEHWGTAMADVTTAVSDVDARYYREYAHRPEQVWRFSNVIDLDAYARIPPRFASLRSPCIYLAGSFYSAQCPMVDAATWLLARVMPIVWRQLPDAAVLIVGKGSDRHVTVTDSRVRVLGEVPSVLPYLCHADAVVVPLRFESGTRFKILEAGACRRAVVSTTLGAEGLDVHAGKDLIIADEPEAFAAGILRLLSDRELADTMGACLFELVSTQYGIDALKREGEAILRFVQKNKRES